MDRFERLATRLIQELDRQANPPSSDCLPGALLERYLADDVDSSARARIDAHLEQCLVCLSGLVDLRDLLDGLKAPGTVSERVAVRLDELTRAPVPLPSRIARFVSRALAIRIPAGWMLVPVTAAAILTWPILLPRDVGHLPERTSPVTSPRTTELAGRPSREAETTLQSFREDTQQRTPSTSPKTTLDEATLVSRTQSAVVLVIATSREAKRTGKADREIGSGFFMNSAGLVLTNYHVIKGSSSISVQLDNGASFDAEIVFISSEKDFAILKVPGRGLPALPLGDSDKIRNGDKVLALGSPLGLENSVSPGFISGYRQLREGAFIQTTVPVSSGSSGGPLLNMQGEVVGIIRHSAPEGQNVNFAIPINEIKAIAMKPVRGFDADKVLQPYLEGVLHFNRQDYAKAEKAFLEATKVNPDNFDAWLDLGSVYYATGQFDKELAAFDKAVRLRPDDDEAHFLLASAYEDKGEFKTAAWEYRRAISLNPKHADALFNLALLELAQGNRAEAVRVSKKLEPLNPGMAVKLQRLLQLTKSGK
jgi:S1-C subfamily serine protease